MGAGVGGRRRDADTAPLALRDVPPDLEQVDIRTRSARDKIGGMKHGILITALVSSFLIPLTEASAQEIPRDEYLTYVPLTYPRLVQQTVATDGLDLYGDRQNPAYRDVNPVDGIDDDRYQVLLSLAVRFAPYLVQNTSNIPTNFDVYIDNSSSFALHLDTWDITGEVSKLTRTEGINFSVLGRAACEASAPGRGGDAQRVPTMEGEIEDCKLVELLSRFSPWGGEESGFDRPLVRQRPDTFTVMFFDFPGEGPKSWKKGYEPEYETSSEETRKAFPHVYVHPFLELAREDGGSPAGYELVLQYWFFYPSNDGGNNHEGDWEHLNVVVSPRSMVERPLSADTVGRILTGALSATDDAPDPLVIRRVEYYFHHLVMTLDFASPNVYQPRNSWKVDVESRPKLRFQEVEIWKAIRHLAYVDDEETVVNTHPFGYIGADNKGFDQALSNPGGKNRNSHGTFPFPGLYHNIGPAGATEEISVYVDPRRYWKRLKSGQVTAGPVFERGHVLGLADPDRVRIVPDWERIVDLTRKDARARREWSWLILPIRWGYPATESPFSGILPNTDTGNLSPLGPSFSSGWNVTGPVRGFHVYEPHTLPSVFPLGLQDSFRNDLGYFNFTLPVLFNLPPLDFLTRIGTYPFKRAFGRRDPVYYPKQAVPFRFFGVSSGVTVQIFDDDFKALALNPAQYDEFVGRIVIHLLESGFDSSTVAVGGAEYKTNSVGPFIQIPFYIGERFASENTVRNMHSEFGVTVDFSNIPSYTYSAEIDYWEYSGSLRYSLSSSRLQPFLKAGYGWSWYRLENVQANGVPFDPAKSEWIKPNNIWPNVWHMGLGIEFVPWKRVGKFPGGTDAAFRFEYALFVESLGLDLSGVPLDKLTLVFNTLGDVPIGERVYRNSFTFGVTVSF
jgi:hypothetical protein